MYKFGNGTIFPLYRTETIDHWPTPRTKRDVQQILGYANTFRTHIPAYADLVGPMYIATGNTFIWGPQQTRALQRLKQALHRMIMTHTHQPNQPATITTDASLFGIAAQLSQNGNTTALISRSLTKAERNYDAAERELLAVVYALDKWIYILEDTPSLLVKTDNMINTADLKHSDSNRRKNRWINKLQRCNITWKHIPGVDNPADYPSRRPDYK